MSEPKPNVLVAAVALVDVDGRVLEGDAIRMNRAGFIIHSAVHMARPDLVCALHIHTTATNAGGALKEGLLPLSQHSLRFYSELTYHGYEGVALDMDERTRLAGDLGPTSRAMILRNHGLLTLGTSISEAIEFMYYLECACQIQVDSLSAGREGVTLMTPDVIEKGRQQFNRPNRESANKHWPALLRMLDRRGSTYMQ